MITLGGVELNDSMALLERYHSKGTAMSVRRTLGGKPVIYVGAITSGLSLTLEASDNFGWLTREVVEQLIEMADVVGATYTLSFNGVNYQVVFDSSSGPAVDMRPLQPRTADEADDYMLGQIKLLTI